MRGRLFNTKVERWELFPFVSLYLKEHCWVYMGFGRWMRGDLLMWVKTMRDKYVVELWDVGLKPVRLQHGGLDNLPGLNLLFSE
ncbi:MAG TPA: hypothetical protein VEY71_03625 [Chitinophagales bacterium]|nr:hypothetical protein [Chitinophagales bacterium]